VVAFRAQFARNEIFLVSEGTTQVAHFLKDEQWVIEGTADGVDVVALLVVLLLVLLDHLLLVFVVVAVPVAGCRRVDLAGDSPERPTTRRHRLLFSLTRTVFATFEQTHSLWSGRVVFLARVFQQSLNVVTGLLIRIHYLLLFERLDLLAGCRHIVLLDSSEHLWRIQLLATRAFRGSTILDLDFVTFLEMCEGLLDSKGRRWLLLHLL